jgi:hypothetical protein
VLYCTALHADQVRGTAGENAGTRRRRTHGHHAARCKIEATRTAHPQQRCLCCKMMVSCQSWAGPKCTAAVENVWEKVSNGPAFYTEVTTNSVLQLFGASQSGRRIMKGRCAKVHAISAGRPSNAVHPTRCTRPPRGATMRRAISRLSPRRGFAIGACAVLLMAMNGHALRP